MTVAMSGSCDGDGRMVCAVLAIAVVVDVEVVSRKLIIVDVSILVSSWSLWWLSKSQRCST